MLRSLWLTLFVALLVSDVSGALGGQDEEGEEDDLAELLGTGAEDLMDADVEEETDLEDLVGTDDEDEDEDGADVSMAEGSVDDITCNTIKRKNPGSKSGLAWLRLGGKKIRAYCDQTTDGGGWTRSFRQVLKYNKWTMKRTTTGRDVRTSRTDTPLPPMSFIAAQFVQPLPAGTRFMVKGFRGKGLAAGGAAGLGAPKLVLTGDTKPEMFEDSAGTTCYRAYDRVAKGWETLNVVRKSWARKTRGPDCTGVGSTVNALWTTGLKGGQSAAGRYMEYSFHAVAGRWHKVAGDYYRRVDGGDSVAEDKAVEVYTREAPRHHKETGGILKLLKAIEARLTSERSSGSSWVSDKQAEMATKAKQVQKRVTARSADVATAEAALKKARKAEEDAKAAGKQQAKDEKAAVAEQRQRFTDMEARVNNEMMLVRRLRCMVHDLRGTSGGSECGVGTSAATAGKSCADILARGGSVGDGTYWVKPTGAAAFEVKCDMSRGGGGWTKVFQISLGKAANCGMNTGSTPQDPIKDSATCSKFSDDVINKLSPGKMFFTTIDGSAPLYTKHTGQVSCRKGKAGMPGKVIQGACYSCIDRASPSFSPTYGGWVLFHQQNWYSSNSCLGAETNTWRLSLEYLCGTNYSPKSSKYACKGSCSQNCPQSKTTGKAQAWVK